MNPEPVALRLPNPAYEGKNVFDAADEGIELSEGDLLDRHRTALYILTQKDLPIPTLQNMEEELTKPDDLQHLELEISELGEQHLLDLERLYAFQAEEYYDECVDRYLSKDDTQFLVQGENNATAVASYKRLEELYEDNRTPADLTALWDDDYSLMRHTHLRQLQSLYQKRVEMEAAQRLEEAQEEEARKRREAQFPLSIEDFRAKVKDVQHRAARFLVLEDGTRQEKMLAEYGWAWRQVKPLQEEMAKNAEFKAEIQALVIELDVKDPRKRS